MRLPTDEETIRYIGRYGGFCRDCGDENGICPTKGLPCDGALSERAIRHVIAALNYGFAHGYLGKTKCLKPVPAGVDWEPSGADYES